MVWERCRLKNFKMAAIVVILDIRTILAILNLCVSMMLPIKFRLNPTYGLGDVLWKFQDGRFFGCRNGTTLQFWIFMLLQCLPSSFGSIPPTVWEEMHFEVFQDGRHGDNFGYQNRIILAILNLCNSTKPPIKFQLSLTFFFFFLFWLAVVWRISRWPLWRSSWILERNNFRNSEPLCHCDASYLVLA